MFSVEKTSFTPFLYVCLVSEECAQKKRRICGSRSHLKNQFNEPFRNIAKLLFQNTAFHENCIYFLDHHLVYEKIYKERFSLSKGWQVPFNLPKARCLGKKRNSGPFLSCAQNKQGAKYRWSFLLSNPTWCASSFFRNSMQFSVKIQRDFKKEIRKKRIRISSLVEKS